MVTTHANYKLTEIGFFIPQILVERRNFIAEKTQSLSLTITKQLKKIRCKLFYTLQFWQKLKRLLRNFYEPVKVSLYKINDWKIFFFRLGDLFAITSKNSVLRSHMRKSYLNFDQLNLEKLSKVLELRSIAIDY